MKRAKEIIRHRVIAMLTKEEFEFLDKLGVDSLFSGVRGTKLSHLDIISALVDAAMALGISGEGVGSKEELTKKILEQVRYRVERRKYPRIKKTIQVGMRAMDSMKEFYNGATANISMGGLCMESGSFSEPPRINEIIEITMNDPGDKGEPVKAIGRVAWIRAVGSDDRLEVGVKLTYIRDEDKERFAKYLSEEDIYSYELKREKL